MLFQIQCVKPYADRRYWVSTGGGEHRKILGPGKIYGTRLRVYTIIAKKM